MNFWGKILKLFGWQVDISPLPPEKCVICVAPHTSNWDFPLGYAAYLSIGRRANFLIKESWFFFPLNYFFKALGGIPVPRERGASLTDNIIRRFKSRDYMNLAVTPEGTRSANLKWRRGFLYIANGADVPVLLGVIDYKSKRIRIHNSFKTSGDIVSDMEYVKDFYRHYGNVAKYPEKFIL